MNRRDQVNRGERVRRPGPQPRSCRASASPLTGERAVTISEGGGAIDRRRDHDVGRHVCALEDHPTPAAGPRLSREHRQRMPAKQVGRTRRSRAVKVITRGDRRVEQPERLERAWSAVEGVVCCGDIRTTGGTASRTR